MLKIYFWKWQQHWIFMQNVKNIKFLSLLFCFHLISNNDGMFKKFWLNSYKCSDSCKHGGGSDWPWTQPLITSSPARGHLNLTEHKYVSNSHIPYWVNNRGVRGVQTILEHLGELLRREIDFATYIHLTAWCQYFFI